MGIRFEVTHEPEFTLEDLAGQLAEALQGSINAQRDKVDFQELKRIERQKIMDLEQLILKVQSFRASPPKKISRMEPMMQYDIDALGEDIKAAHKRIQEFDGIINSNQESLAQAQSDIIRLQNEIAERRNKG